MKAVKTIDEYNSLPVGNGFVIEFGTPETCIPCKFANENLKKFEEMLKISDNENPGSSYDLIASFVYLGLDEFFYKNTPFKKKVEQSVTFDDLNGVLSKDFILSFVGDKAKERKLLKIAKTLKMKISTVNRIVSLERIFSSKDTIDRKKERIENMYKAV